MCSSDIKCIKSVIRLRLVRSINPELCLRSEFRRAQFQCYLLTKITDLDDLVSFQVGQNLVKQSDNMLYRFTAQEILCACLGVPLKRGDIKFKLREKHFNPD